LDHGGPDGDAPGWPRERSMFNLMVFVAGREGLTMEAFLEH
jgi:hypothetical protein